MEVLFILKKIIGFILQPYGLILSSFLLTIIFYFLGKKLLTKLSFMTGLLLLFLFANPFVANSLSFYLENIYPRYAEQQAQYIIVMGNAHNENPNIPTSSMLSDAGTKRTLEAVMIYKQMQNKPKIIFTGYNSFGKKFTYASMSAKFAKSLGVNPKDIIIMGSEKDSDDEVETAKKIAGNNKIIVITSAMHMPRVANMFKKYQLNFIPAPADFHTNNKGFFSRPAIKYLQQSNFAIHEYLGLVLEYIKTLWND